MVRRLTTHSMLALVALVGTATACDPGGAQNDGSVCEQAADIVEECTGEAPPPPAEGCVGDFLATSEQIVEQGCAGVDQSGGKADADGFWCLPINLWLGLCNEVSLEEAGAIVSVDEVCDGRGSDPLCGALDDRDLEGARAEVATRVAEQAREDVLHDPAVRLYLRERTISLLAYHVVTGGTGSVDGDTYLAEARDMLTALFPAYDPNAFVFAAGQHAPQLQACDQPSAAVVFFPGVVRLTNRDEFSEQGAAIEAAVPCLRTYRVDTGSFVHPTVNAQRGRAAVDQVDAELGDVPLHLLGYSQGSSNALRTLVDFPDIADRTVSVITLNSAAHGSEVADTMGKLLAGLTTDICEELPSFMRPSCHWAADRSPQPGDFLLKAIAAAMAVPVEDLQAFINAEDDIAPAATLRDFLVAHVPGVDSLTTEAAARFWSESGDDLPTDTLYFSFRSVISDEDANLPFSNAVFHSLLQRAGSPIPWNDMQVRLENQSLGDAVEDVEVVSPVAEGNHWQWALADGAVPETVMPRDMTERIPHRELLTAYYQTLAEVGLLSAK